MNAELVKRLHATRLTRGQARLLATELPTSEQELQQVVEALVASADEAGLTALVFAMVAGGRTIEARMLHGVLPLMRGLDGVSVAALHARGEVVATIIQAVEGGLMGCEREAVLLMIAGWICLNREPRQPLPPALIAKARLLARDIGPRLEALLPLFALARITNNAALQTVLEDYIVPPPPGAIETALEFIVEKPLKEPLASLPEQLDRVLTAEGPLRRAVAKIGRNDSCPCGSGKKYKKCCFEKDQERLQRSSDVAGVTVEELDALPEPFLTREKLEEMRGPKLAQLRIERIAPSLQPFFLDRLAVFKLHDVLLKAWETVGWRDDLRVAYENAVFNAAHDGNRDFLTRLMALRGLTPDHDALGINGRLLLAQDDPARFLELIEQTARRSLEDAQDLDCVDLACGLTECKYPGLATLLARGVATTARFWEADLLLEAMHKLRDRLNLPPDEPAEWVLDRHYDLPEELDEQTREELAAARQQMRVTDAEVGRLRTQLAEARAQLERQERLARTRSSPTTAANSASSEPDPRLRSRVDELKAALKERHAERNALRRELGEALKEAAELREELAKDAAQTAARSDANTEEQQLLPEEQAAAQPVRVPSFAERFLSALDTLPQHATRAAMVSIGKLAAGEPEVFAGMRRLRISREICRVRVAADYRLLFKLLNERIEILDFINRKDFEKWLKTQV